MKKLMFVFCLLLGAAFVVNAQDPTPADQPSQTELQTEEGDAIAVSELPTPVRDALASQDYAAWTANNAFRKEKDGKTMYVVEMRKGDETKKVKFDSEGNKIKDKDKDKKKDY